MLTRALPQRFGNEKLAALLPHQGAMCLLDKVVSWDATTLTALATSHQSTTNPLNQGNHLLAHCGVEYAAQAAAVHLAVKALQQSLTVPQKGYLAAVNQLQWQSPYLEYLGPLTIQVEQLVAQTRGCIYYFNISADNQSQVSGRFSLALVNS
jgi:predicted hotdog family 3-hydroxylacyl-ACP dehydratase